MNIGAIFIGIALFVLVIPFVSNPFRKTSSKKNYLTHGNGNSTENQHDQVLVAIRDLDFDYQTEKISEEDYSYVRGQLLAEAASIIQAKQLEDEQVEEIIRSRQNNNHNELACPNCSESVQKGNKYCPSCGLQITSVCPACNKEHHSGDQFCTNCGTQLIQ